MVRCHPWWSACCFTVVRYHFFSLLFFSCTFVAAIIAAERTIRSDTLLLAHAQQAYRCNPCALLSKLCCVSSVVFEYFILCFALRDMWERKESECTASAIFESSYACKHRCFFLRWSVLDGCTPRRNKGKAKTQEDCCGGRCVQPRRSLTKKPTNEKKSTTTPLFSFSILPPFLLRFLLRFPHAKFYSHLFHLFQLSPYLSFSRFFGFLPVVLCASYFSLSGRQNLVSLFSFENHTLFKGASGSPLS